MKIGHQIFELSRGINVTNVLTKFHEDWTVNVTSGVFTRQILTAHDAHRTTDKRRSQKLTMSTLCSVINTASGSGSQINILTIFHEDWIEKWPIDCQYMTYEAQVLMAYFD
ncbi:hypothetical protein DPMN_056854 [Dreissena polymorpha]|uniref:Uncharacterized protein n=1 Tax=Dreissena polymorpha TaxID=45954 RepID=A0A9D4HTZ9_DREPO|nr:hypothetical protein DPMN_056854 [Dreissena polymorpha]